MKCFAGWRIVKMRILKTASLWSTAWRWFYECDYLNPLPDGREEPRLVKTGDIFRTEQILLKLFIFQRHSLSPDSLKCGSVSSECWHWLARRPDSISWNRSILNVSCSWLVCFPIGIIIVVSESCSDLGPESQQMTRVTAASLLMKLRSSEFYESWGRILYNEDCIS